MEAGLGAFVTALLVVGLVGAVIVVWLWALGLIEDFWARWRE